MQAGDQLHFIKPFEGTETKLGDDAEFLSEDDAATLAILHHRFVSRNPENVHEFPVVEDAGLISMFESSYKLNMPDESYLHVLTFGSYDENGLLDINIAINEHLANGMLNGGFMYTCLPGEGLTRTRIHADRADDLDDNYADPWHFTISSYYELQDEYKELQTSDNPERQQVGKQIEEELHSSDQFREIMKVAGYDDLPPYPGELDQVLQLVWDAEPFPLHLK